VVRVYPAVRQGSLERISWMSFVFLYKLKGKNILHFTKFFICPTDAQLNYFKMLKVTLM
jgi:hypothetical protein